MILPNSPALSRRRVILFGRQASSSLFLSSAASCAENDARSSASRPRFLAECRRFDTRNKVLVGLDPGQFTGLGDFWKTPSQFHHNGVVQSTTLCLYQLLHCLAEMEESTLSSNSPTDRVLETTGFCSGLIAAAVVDSSSSSELLNFGVEAFRLAFWIGCRTVVEHKMHGQFQNLEATWSLIVLGLVQAEVGEHRRKFLALVIDLS